MTDVCGIIGSYRNPLDRTTSLALIAHRGPDGDGWAEIDGACLGHTRLAIQDPSALAAQPFVWGSTTLTYNGEAYNAAELRAQLGAELDTTWSTSGDTELVAALLDRYGPAGLERVEGMFGLAWHGRDGVWLARDRWGKIPLYALRAGDSWVWASELKALPRFAEATPVPPGCAVHVNTGRVVRWARPRWTTTDFSPARVRELLTDGVRQRLLSDRPVCFLLSGGLDSTMVLTMARQLHPDPVAYTAVYDRNSADLVAARRVAADLGVPLVEVPVPDPTRAAIAEAVHTIETAMKAQVEITLANLPLARAIASDGFRVVLSGEAADELFGGYGNLIRAAHGATDEQWRRLRRAQLDKMARGNFLRVNKVFMAVGVEARLPFMHRPLVELALSAGMRECPPGKGLLKAAAAGLAPSWVIKRTKDTFQGGTGIADAAAKVVASPVRFYNAEARRMFGYIPGRVAA